MKILTYISSSNTRQGQRKNDKHDECGGLQMKNRHTYKPLFEVPDGRSNEIHFALRDDDRYIISRCQILRGGEKAYMRSSVTMTKSLAIEVAKKILETLDR